MRSNECKNRNTFCNFKIIFRLRIWNTCTHCPGTAIFLKTYELYFRLREKYILQISPSIESVLSYYIDILLFDRASIKFVILHPSLSLSLIFTSARFATRELPWKISVKSDPWLLTYTNIHWKLHASIWFRIFIVSNSCAEH